MGDVSGETVYIESQCLDHRPGTYVKQNRYFSQLDMIREQRRCPAELVNVSTSQRTGNYSHTNRSCPCNGTPFRSYKELIRCVNRAGGRNPCDTCG